MAIQAPIATTQRHSLVDGSRRHVLDLDDFAVAELDLVMETTDAMREVLGRDIKKVPTLRGKVIITLFYEASTRTRVSFEEAGKLL
ncbi:MAG: aspartate carbamoyltransferase, partial [Chloroflexi bacterium]|nr:aspartate carbamoyltransferase [Chloroflexota bacterium]